MLTTRRSKRQRGESSTAGSALPSKKTILQGRSTTWLTNIPNTRLSRISGAASTSRGPDFYPFWDPSCEEEYRKWWLPAETGCAGLRSISCNGSSKGTVHKSWFSMTKTRPRTRILQKIYLRSCKYSLVDGTEKGGTPPPGYTAFKTRAYPNEYQKSVLAKIEAATRFLYNKATEMIRDRVAPFDSISAYRDAEAARRKPFEDKEAKRYAEWCKKADKHNADEDAREALWRTKKNEESGSKRKVPEFKRKEAPVFVPQAYKPTEYPWLNKYWMRDYLVTEKGKIHRDHPWLKEFPKHTKEAAVYEAIEATSAAFSNRRNGNINSFRMSFRSKKTGKWSLSLANNAASKNVFFRRTFKDFQAMRVAEDRGLRERYSSEITISKDQYGRFWMITREKTSTTDKSESQAPARRRVVMAVDPGVRTRHAVYSSNGKCYKIGDKDTHKLAGLCVEVDRCVSILSRGAYLLNSKDHRYCLRTGDRKGLFRKDTGRKKTPGGAVVHMSHQEIRLLKQKLRRIRARVNDLKREIDNQTVNFMCRKADAVLIPKFDSHSMARGLRTKTARAMMNWRHGEFRQLLQERGRRRGLEVMVVGEHYTSKTCGQCGHLKANLGGAKVYKCGECGVHIDRDFNGARNIFLRSIRQSFEPTCVGEDVGR